MSLGRLIGRRLPLVLAAALVVGLAALACSGEDIEQVDEADQDRLKAQVGLEFGSIAKSLAQFEADLYPDQEEGVEDEGSDAASTTLKIKSSTHLDTTVPVGTVLEWRNEDGVSHTSTAGTPDDPSGLWDSGRIEAGTSFTLTLDEPGEYQYFCSIHIFMTATVTVTE